MEAKKTKHGECDRLMELPEGILFHILSYLPMKDVIKTSVLAKRWRYVWSYVPCLNFPPTRMTAEREIAFINRTLLFHKASEIQKFSITLEIYNLQDADYYNIDSWVLFAAARNVKELHLIFSGFYQVLPRCVFKCGSLTVLELRSCTIEMPAEFRLNSLKSLSLEDISCGWEHANALLAASPNVERLSLINCNRSDCRSEKIDLFIMNLNLKTLKIEEFEFFYGNQTLEVYAPYVINFDLAVSMWEKSVFLTRMKSLESVTLGYSVSYWHEVNDGFNTIKILDNVCHVKDLTLRRNYIQETGQLISTMEEKMEGFLSLNCTYLELKTTLTEEELAAIVFILKLSRNIRTLVISIEKPKVVRIPRGVDKILQKTEITDVLKNLETIKVNDFMKNISSRTEHKRRIFGKFLCTKGRHCTTEELASQLEDDMSFLKFLLQNSPALKSMTIGLTKHLNLDQSKMMQLQLLIHERLLQAFPRTSRDVVVSFTGN